MSKIHTEASRSPIGVRAASMLPIAILLHGSIAHALTCQAKIAGITISHKEPVLVSAIGPGVSMLDDELCNLGGSVGTKAPISTQACKAMLSLLHGAIAVGA